MFFCSLIGDFAVLIISCVGLFYLSMLAKDYYFKEKFGAKNKNGSVQDFDKNVIQLDKLKNDEPKIKDFKLKKTSELKLFCNQGVDASKLSCYQQ